MSDGYIYYNSKGSVDPPKGRMKNPNSTAFKVLVRDKYKCHYCGVTVDPNLKPTDDLFATMDHVVPIKHGGKSNLDNLVLACYKCNNAKGHKSYISFWRKMKMEQKHD